VRPQLAKREIAAEHGQPREAERIRQRHEERRLAIRPRTVRQDEPIVTRIGGAMDEPSNGWFIFRTVAKLLAVIHIRNRETTLKPDIGRSRPFSPMAAGIWRSTRLD
jgi:hypothetical protein